MLLLLWLPTGQVGGLRNWLPATHLHKPCKHPRVSYFKGISNVASGVLPDSVQHAAFLDASCIPAHSCSQCISGITSAVYIVTDGGVLQLGRRVSTGTHVAASGAANQAVTMGSHGQSMHVTGLHCPACINVVSAGMPPTLSCITRPASCCPVSHNSCMKCCWQSCRKLLALP
jgi:hypothetical protein